MKKDGALFHQYILDNLYDGVYVVAPDRKIIYWNNGAERITGYGCPEVIGKRCCDNLLIHVDGKGLNLCHTQCPLVDTINDGKLREEEIYLHHKDGHRVPVLVRVVPLRGLDNQIVGGIEVFSDNTSRVMLRERINELEKMNMLDKLTKLSNKGYVEIQMTSELAKMQRYGWPLGVLFIDIDNFKNINDTYGHEIGDKVLKMVASTISSNSRLFDLIGRWGGEEFIAILVNVTTRQVYDIANRYRILVEQSKLFIESSIVQVTVSIGATVAQPTDTVEGLIDRADRLMYQSKLAGRNHVTTDQEITVPGALAPGTKHIGVEPR
jgi:diguanylate cyclase (GGDEF)-like protein/PAS domain S-box-containing protein